MTRIDRTNSITRGLLRAVIPQRGVYARNAVNGFVHTNAAGTYSFEQTQKGLAGFGSESGQPTTLTTYSTEQPFEDYAGKEMTIAVMLRIDSVPASGGEIVCGESGAGGHICQIAVRPNHWEAQFKTNWTGPLLLPISTPDADPTPGHYYFVVVTMNRNGPYAYAHVRDLTTGNLETDDDTTDIADDFVGITNFSPFNHDSHAVIFYGCWTRALSLGEISSLEQNPWQIFKPQRIVMPIYPYDATAVTEEEVQPSIVDGSITFDITADKQPTNKLTAAATATMLVNLLQEQTAKDLDVFIDFDITADKALTNTATRPVIFSATINLDKVSTNTATYLRNTLFDLSADYTATNVKTSNNIITFNTALDYNALNNIIAEADASLAIELADTLLNTLSVDKLVNFDIVLDELETNQLDALKIVTLDTILDQAQVNQLDADKLETFGISLDDLSENALTALGNIELATNLSYEILNTLAANTSITLNTNLTDSYIGEGAGEVIATISFLVNLDHVPTNTITISKAVDLITSLDAQFNNAAIRAELIQLLISAAQEQSNYVSVDETIVFGTTLTQEQSNLATRVALSTFNAALEAGIETQLDYNLFVNLATTLYQQVATDGEIDVALTFGVNVDEQYVNTKTMAEAISLALSAQTDTSIHLTAEGQVTLSNQMSTVIQQQLDKQANITFGQLLGLASVNGAILEADIAFSTIQDFSHSEFLLEFTIVTPDNRTLRVNIDDRTIMVDGRSRVFRISR